MHRRVLFENYLVLEIEGWDSRILTRKSRLRPCQTPVQVFPAARPAGIAQPREEMGHAARTARSRRVMIHNGLALLLHAAEDLRGWQRLNTGRRIAHKDRGAGIREDQFPFLLAGVG